MTWNPFGADDDGDAPAPALAQATPAPMAEAEGYERASNGVASDMNGAQTRSYPQAPAPAQATPAPGRCPDCGGPQWRDGLGRPRCEACDGARLRAVLMEGGFADWLAGIEADAANHQANHEAAPADDDLPDWANPSGWAELGGGVLVRRNHPEAATLDWDALAEPGEPCRTCGSIAFWEGHDGGHHCGRCEQAPLDGARRLIERAADLRRRYPPQPKAKIPRQGG